MMTSSAQYKEAYVWIWLPGAIEPCVAGKLEAANGGLLFNYGKSYLERINDNETPAISLYEKELPLREGALPCLRGWQCPVVSGTLCPMRGGGASS